MNSTNTTATAEAPSPAEVLTSLIPLHVERHGWSRAQVERHQRDALRRALAHAAQNSPFHARRLGRTSFDDFEVAGLCTLPTMTKDEMMASFDDVVTDRRLTSRAVEDHLAHTQEEPSLLFGEYLVLASGGSSGVRGFFVYDCEAAAQYVLSGVRGSIARMLQDGLPAGGTMRIAMVAASSAVHATRALPGLFSGGLMQVTSIPATIALSDIVRRLEQLQPDGLQGYPTVIAMLADARAAGRASFSPRTITTSSEPLGRELRERIERGFGVPVCDQFGSSEGLMGLSEPGDDRIVMPGDLVILELVDDDNEPVPAGTESSKVLVTTLYNRVQPLIRYELTDRMTVCERAAGSGHDRVTVSGRSDDLLRYGEAVVHPHAMRSVLVNTASVREYQIRQTEDGADVAVVPAGATRPDEAALSRRIADAMRAAGVRGAAVRVRVVEHLPRDARSGKTRRILPLVEAPLVEAPLAEAPLAEAPLVEAPLAEAPLVEAPLAEAPPTPRGGA